MRPGQAEARCARARLLDGCRRARVRARRAAEGSGPDLPQLRRLRAWPSRTPAVPTLPSRWPWASSSSPSKRSASASPCVELDATATRRSSSADSRISSWPEGPAMLYSARHRCASNTYAVRAGYRSTESRTSTRKVSFQTPRMLAWMPSTAHASPTSRPRPASIARSLALRAVRSDSSHSPALRWTRACGDQATGRLRGRGWQHGLQGQGPTVERRSFRVPGRHPDRPGAVAEAARTAEPPARGRPPQAARSIRWRWASSSEGSTVRSCSQSPSLRSSCTRSRRSRSRWSSAHGAYRSSGSRSPA